MFYNWYDPSTGEKLTVWPNDGSTVHPFLSSVDNGWLATGLQIVVDEVPSLADEAHAVLDEMDFGYYYNPAENQIRGGFWVDPPPGCSVPDNYRGGEIVYYTCHHYGAFNTEPRMASYLGIAAEQIPQRHYFGTWRTFPPEGCDWSWTEQRGVGEWREHLGVRVFEGAYRYRGMRMVPTWGGSMFEALMVPLFVPEDRWGTRSWARTHPVYVQAQIEHGMDRGRLRLLGLLAVEQPRRGLPRVRRRPDRHGAQRLLVRPGADHRGRGLRRVPPAQPAPTSYGQGVVTPHASFLALRYAPKESLRNLKNLREDFGAYGPGGFYDAVERRAQARCRSATSRWTRAWSWRRWATRSPTT